MTEERYILDLEALPEIRDTTLFYPCSGNDWQVPIKLFSPSLTVFWFVDKAYFRKGSALTREYGFDAPADEQKPILEGNPDYRLAGKPTVVGPPNWPLRDSGMRPCVLTERYEHIPSGRTIKVHRRRGCGFPSFNKKIISLGVFFYRGDSQGEGGSGNLWLASGHLDGVCEKLVDGGLVVTDGSQHDYWYEELWKYHTGDCPSDAEEIVATAKPFTDRKGRLFTCIGYAGHKYGPTLVWQVRKPAQPREIVKGKRILRGRSSA